MFALIAQIALIAQNAQIEFKHVCSVVQAKLIQALWLYMPPYVANTNEIIITGVISTASNRRRLLASSGSGDVTTELDVGNASSVAAAASHLSSVVTGTQFLVSSLAAVFKAALPCCNIHLQADVPASHLSSAAIGNQSVVSNPPAVSKTALPCCNSRFAKSQKQISLHPT